ncbi:MAG: long-chain fatty acid--CoA ligase, partial [Anaerolineae bacterium]|nr:long-chain fatty acid--CoA ligase [Anaerolineae bacterium]MCB0238091.1 long-chain fatty acid--CoA ligase [Anaerolineae bacterium]
MPPFNTNQPWLQHYDANVPQHLDYPHIPLYRLLDDAAERTPTTRCATFFGKGYSYRSLKDASDHFAAALQ